MSQTKNDLYYGALLHDIGKVVQRQTQERRGHDLIGYDFLKEYTSSSVLLDQVKYHHIKRLERANLKDDNLAYITYYADNISSATDRRNLDAEAERISRYNFNTWTNLADIFNHFGDVEGEKFYQPSMLQDEDVYHFAKEQYRQYNHGDYFEIVKTIRDGLASITFDENYQTSLLDLLESTLSFVPSSTHLEQARDVSLYDHSKLTAAIALCIYDYFEEKNDHNYAQLLDSHQFNDEAAFLLLKYDISGIQDFIYTIRDQQAAKMLRSRSFYLEMLGENLNHQLIKRLSLSRANLLYSGGGGAFFIVPNTEKAKEIIQTVEAEINLFLRETFGTQLYIAFGYEAFTPNMVKDNQGAMSPIYQNVSQKINAQKLNRYTADDIIKLNQFGKQIGRECNICHRIHKNEDTICSICQALIHFSNNLQRDEFFLVTPEENNLPIGFGEYLNVITKEGILENNFQGRIYSKNKFYTGKYQATHLWVGDYTDTSAPTFNDYLIEGLGIKRLGVVRCDVDNLGDAFINGYSDHFKSLSRTTTLSRSLSLFFQYYINLILKENHSTASIIYAGGDDVFVVGHWLDMIEFAIEIRQKFKEFTQNKLTLSAGIGLFPGKTPISIMAKQTGDLENAAKLAYDDKDAITLFHPDYTFKWDQFIDKVWTEKFNLIDQFFTDSKFDNNYGKSFLYRLVELIRQSFSEVEDGTRRGEYKTMSWAQWVYYLSRLEPEQREAKEAFRTFSQQLHQYFEDEQEIKELELAIILYIYTIRGDE